MNRRSFRSNLKHMLKYYGLSSELKDLDRVVVARNNLVHGACLVNKQEEFPDGIDLDSLQAEEIDRHFMLVSLVDKLLLRTWGTGAPSEHGQMDHGARLVSDCQAIGRVAALVLG